MAIPIPSDKIIYKHYTYSRTGDGLEQYILTGVVIIGLNGPLTDWRREQIDFRLTIPKLPRFKVLKLKHWAPLVTINAIENRGHAIDGGHAVDSFRILEPREPSSAFTTRVDIAIKDRDAILQRLGYQLTLVGEYVDAPVLE